MTATNGDAIAVGYGRDGSGWDWFVKRSQDSGRSWTFLESGYSYQAGYYSVPYDAAESPVAGDLYVVGGAADLAGLRWIVRYAPSTSDSFTGLPDNYQLVLGRNAQARAIAIDAVGNIYVGGKAEDSLSKYHWIIRKSEDRGFSWTTIDDFQLSSSGNAEVYDLHVAKDGRIFAAGYGDDSNGFSHWIVRRSINGNSFETVDNFLNPNPKLAHNNIAYSIAEDSQGVIYITGQEHDDDESSNYGYMVLKRSTDSGESWEKFDNYLKGSSSGQTGRSVVIDTNDNIFYGGSVGYSRHSIKRRVCITEQFL